MDDVPSSEEDFDLDTIPGKALNVSSRITLSMLLNPKMPLPSSNGYARDFRGLAQQMDFEYVHIRNFECHTDPTSQVLEAWENKSDATIGSLIRMLKEMDRHDVVEDCLQQFKIDAMSHLHRSRLKSEIPIQVPAVTSCGSVVEVFQFENQSALTVQDLMTGGFTHYDLYVCYAVEDEFFVGELAKFLESAEIGLSLFIKGRDQLCGISEPDAYVKLIEERCNKMLVVLSPDFLNSSECDFQASYAAGLAIEQRRRKIIPISVKACKVPSILKFLTVIDFTKPDVHRWLWMKLVVSIRGIPPATGYTSETCPPLPNRYRNQAAIEPPPSAYLQSAIQHYTPYLQRMVERPMPSLQPAIEQYIPPLEIEEHPASSEPVITFPPTLSFQLPHSRNVATLDAAVCSTLGFSAVAMPSTSEALVHPTPAPTQKSSSASKHKWLRNFRGKFSSSSSTGSSRSANSLSASSSTSGFQSQSDETLESDEIPEDETTS